MKYEVRNLRGESPILIEITSVFPSPITVQDVARAAAHRHGYRVDGSHWTLAFDGEVLPYDADASKVLREVRVYELVEVGAEV